MCGSETRYPEYHVLVENATVDDDSNLIEQNAILYRRGNGRFSRNPRRCALIKLRKANYRIVQREIERCDRLAEI